MVTVVVYDSKFGNTQRVAEAIARGAGTHGTVHVMPVDQGAAALASRPDLFIVGGPTQRRNMSPDLRAFVEAITARSLSGIRAAAFDTRYRGATLIMGSAANEVSKRFRKAGAALASPPESFFIGRSGPMERQGLESGELARAEDWGRAVAAAESIGRGPSV